MGNIKKSVSIPAILLIALGFNTTIFFFNYQKVRATSHTNLSQQNYKWYSNNDSVTPAASLAAENTPTSNITSGSTLRLRINASSSVNVALGQTLKLQYSTSKTGPWSDLGLPGSAEIWRGFNNISVPDGEQIKGWGSSKNGFETFNWQGDTLNVITDMVKDSSGNIYVGGHQNTNYFEWFVRKYSTDGIPDSSWGSGGEITYQSRYGRLDMVKALAVDSQNNLYVGGIQQSNNYDWVIRKYNSTGVLDTSWGDVATPGMVTYNSGVGDSGDVITSMVLDYASDSGIYRKPIYIDNSGSTQSNYLVKITDPVFNETGLVGSWHLDDISGTNVTDSSSNGNNGVSSVSSNIVAGKFGNARSFNGSSQKVTISTNIVLNPGTSNWTVATWVKTTATAKDIVSKGGTTDYYRMRVDSAGKARFLINFGGASAEAISTTSINNGAWHYLVGIRDASNSVKIYVDGELQGQGTCSCAGTNLTNTNSLFFASRGTTDYFNGTIDEVKIYNRSLLSTEIQDLYNAKVKLNYENIRFYDTDGIAELPYWKKYDSEFWVKIPSVPTGKKTIYVQYGGALSSVSDPTVGTGADTLPKYLSYEEPVGAATHSLYAGGYYDLDMVVRKYTSSGALDTTWGDAATPGMIKYDSSGGDDGDTINSLSLDSSKNLYLVGWGAPTGIGTDWVIRKYNYQGKIDSSWGNTGPSSAPGMIVYNSVEGGADGALRSVLDPINNLYIAGHQQTWGLAQNNWAIRKYSPFGTLDTSWGTAGSGMIQYDAAGDHDTQPSGGLTLDYRRNLYASGYEGLSADVKNGIVFKYTPSGALDTTWGDGDVGKITIDAGSGDDNDWTSAIFVDPSNRLYVSGNFEIGDIDPYVKRYTTTGDLDSAFANSGTLIINTNLSSYDEGRAVALDNLGNVYVAGSSANGGGDWIIRKYKKDGTLDAPWGDPATPGMVAYNHRSGFDAPYAIAADVDRNIYVAGMETVNQYVAGGGYYSEWSSWVIRKYNSDGSLDVSWGDAATPGMVIYNPTQNYDAEPLSIVVDALNNIYVAGYHFKSATGWDSAIRKYTSTG